MTPSSIWQWFLANGDKLLVAIGAYFATPQGQAIGGKYAASIALVAGAIHMLFFPEPSASSSSSSAPAAPTAPTAVK